MAGIGLDWVRLKAGDYQFTRWEYGGYLGGSAKFAVRIKPLKFTVEAQHAVYLGNFDPVMFTGTFKSGHKYVEPWLTVRNKSSRDVGVFLKKCSNFDVSQIDVKVMDPTPWTPRKDNP